MANLTDALHDDRVAHQLDLLRLDARLRKDILAMLDELRDDITAQLARFNPEGKYSVREDRLRKLKAKVDDAIKQGYADIADGFDEAMMRLATVEPEYVVRSLNRAIGVEVASVNFTARQLAMLSQRTLIEGAPSREWWMRQSTILQDRFIDAMRSGVLQGESLGQLVKRVRGTKEKGYSDAMLTGSKRRAEAIVRTSVMTIANAASYETYQQNRDLIAGIEWVATLDNRTTDICRALDGLTWTLDGEPIGHDKAYPGSTAHWGCRSTQVPVTKSWAALATNKELGRKLDAMTKGTRASMDGQVSATMNYEQWLRSKPEEFQREVLGTGRYNLWKKGLVGMSDLTDQSNRPLTIAELEEKIGKM